MFIKKIFLQLISECLQVVRKFTLDDDIRVEFGRAHEHARELGVLLLDPLMELLKGIHAFRRFTRIMALYLCLVKVTIIT